MADHPSITCPQCGRESYHPKDIQEQYCGACHQFHADMGKPYERAQEYLALLRTVTKARREQIAALEATLHAVTKARTALEAAADSWPTLEGRTPRRVLRAIDTALDSLMEAGTSLAAHMVELLRGEGTTPP